MARNGTRASQVKASEKSPRRRLTLVQEQLEDIKDRIRRLAELPDGYCTDYDEPISALEAAANYLEACVSHHLRTTEQRYSKELANA